MSLQLREYSVVRDSTSHIAYAYVPSPLREQVEALLTALAESGLDFSHLGKTDPPKKWTGTIREAVALIFDDQNLTVTVHPSRTNDGALRPAR